MAEDVRQNMGDTQWACVGADDNRHSKREPQLSYSGNCVDKKQSSYSRIRLHTKQLSITTNISGTVL